MIDTRPKGSDTSIVAHPSTLTRRFMRAFISGLKCDQGTSLPEFPCRHAPGCSPYFSKPTCWSMPTDATLFSFTALSTRGIIVTTAIGARAWTRIRKRLGHEDPFDEPCSCSLRTPLLVINSALLPSPSVSQPPFLCARQTYLAGPSWAIKSKCATP